MRPTIKMAPGLGATETLDRLAADPEGWTHPTNRALARAVPHLRAANIPDEAIRSLFLLAR